MSAATTLAIPDWRKMDREELHTLVATLVERGSLREDPAGDFTEALLSARTQITQERVTRAIRRYQRAGDAWNETLKGDRTSARAALHAAKARLVYDRAKRAMMTAERQEREAWAAMEAFWKARRL